MAVQIYGVQHETPTHPNHQIVRTGEAFERMMNRLRVASSITFDFETSGTAWWAHAKPCGIAFSVWDESWAIHSYYVPYRHDTGEEQLDVCRIGGAVKALLENPWTLKIAHNLKFDSHMARTEGWNLQGPRYDTMVAARLFDENEFIGLKHRAKVDLGQTQADSWEKPLNLEIAQRAKQLKIGVTRYKELHGFSQIPIDLCGTYACWDVHYTTMLYFKYEKWGVSRKYPRIWPTEMALTEVLGDMERIGLPIDVDYLEALRDGLAGEKVALEQKIWAHTPQFNLGSDAALRKYLLNTLKLPLHKETESSIKNRFKKGHTPTWSVDREALEEFEDRDPTIPLILEWRDADKVENTYTTSLLTLADSASVIHPNFQSVGTNTGRLSCREPNFQNQPTDDSDRALAYSGKKLEDGGIDPWSIRRAFVVPENTVRLFFDYSQIELRVLAYYSKDPVMREAYLNGEDIHTRTSLEVFGTDAKEKRRLAKVINFGLSYCLSAQGFSRQAKIPLEDAEKHLETFFKKYAGITDFRTKLWTDMFYNNCEVNNLFGRTRRVPELRSEDGRERNRAQRQAIGSLIQGTAAELTKESLVRIYNLLRAEHPDAHLVNTVHDEIQIDCPPHCFAAVARGVKQLMENFPEFAPIPIIAEGDYSTTNWAEKTSLPKPKRDK